MVKISIFTGVAMYPFLGGHGMILSGRGGMYTPLWVPHLSFYSIQWSKIANIIWF